VQSILRGTHSSSSSDPHDRRRSHSANYRKASHRPVRNFNERSPPKPDRKRQEQLRPLADLSGSPPRGRKGFNESEMLQQLCGANNTALYGPCIATDFDSLQASGAVEAVYSGIPWSFSMIKKDAYNSTIISDSLTLLQAIPILATGKTDSRTSILGSAVTKMAGGVATFSFAVKAMFSSIDLVKKFAAVYPSIALSVEGTDAECGQTMKSDMLPVQMQQGANVCPEGYVLTIDMGGAVSPAVCTFCKAGTYSLSPLTRMSGDSTESPTCLICPFGLDCKGGAEVLNKQKNSTWLAVDGEYYLISCPAGSQLINSTSGTSQGEFLSSIQQCRMCTPGQYIIDPNTDACQQCPPGMPVEMKMDRDILPTQHVVL
jgi:hypothetical protein